MIRLERAVAVAQQHQDVAEALPTSRSGLPSRLMSATVRPVGSGPASIGERMRQEAPLAVAAIDAHAVWRRGRSTSGMPSPFEVGDADRPGRAGRGKVDRVGEPAAAQARSAGRRCWSRG